MKRLLIATLALASVAAFATDRVRQIIHVSHLTPTEVGITCANGGDPTGVKTGDVLVISCGK
jgi:hypothetical protein